MAGLICVLKEIILSSFQRLKSRKKLNFLLQSSPIRGIITTIYGGIAQLVRALASHARGRRFKSYCLYQII